MKKNLFIILMMIFLNPVFATEGFYPYLSKGTFVPLCPMQTISTSVLEMGNQVGFIVPSDMWIGNHKIIPKNSMVLGHITELSMPVTGINASMKIAAHSICFRSGECFEIQGDVAYRGETRIGGDLTPPLSYNVSMHPAKGEYYVGAFGQYVPSGKYEFGQHVTILTNETLHLILTEDFEPR